jgi:diguanylate cyclase (GGDEF)-like protein
MGLLTAAFVSVARRNPTHASRAWLIGWTMIALHFTAALFQRLPGIPGLVAQIVTISSLTWAGLLFIWASVPYRQENSTHRIFLSLAVSNTLYIGLMIGKSQIDWTFIPAAILLGGAPLLFSLASLRRCKHPLRWALVGMYASLSVWLLLVQSRPGNGADLALDGVLSTVYFVCCLHFWYTYRRATAGALVTIAGFFTWAMVWVAAPLVVAFLPTAHVESEVWNLPKYVVAVGMILLLLEEQIERNLHLALHDHLTGLPNRRLYQDRLASALERARRTEAKAAVLVIDLDGFKKVNDTLGHHVGDLVLQRVGALFSTRVRRSDTVARTGGDEFSIVLEEPTSRADAELVGQSLKQLLLEPIELGEHRVRIGASIGIAVFPEDAREMEALSIAADLRMYDAKNDVHERRAQEVVPALKMAPARSVPPARRLELVD